MHKSNSIPWTQAQCIIQPRNTTSHLLEQNTAEYGRSPLKAEKSLHLQGSFISLPFAPGDSGLNQFFGDYAYHISQLQGKRLTHTTNFIFLILTVLLQLLDLSPTLCFLSCEPTLSSLIYIPQRQPHHRASSLCCKFSTQTSSTLSQKEVEIKALQSLKCCLCFVYKHVTERCITSVFRSDLRALQTLALILKSLELYQKI